MTLEHALVKAQQTANRTGCSVLVYRATHLPADAPNVYGVEFTLPIFGVRVGERIEPDPCTEGK